MNSDQVRPVLDDYIKKEVEKEEDVEEEEEEEDYDDCDLDQMINYAKKKNAIIINLRDKKNLCGQCQCRKHVDDLELKELHKAIKEAAEGDINEEDPTVKELQKKTAELLGKEDSLLVSSDITGNIIAIMNHCDVPGSELYCGVTYEIYGILDVEHIADVNRCILPYTDDGTFDLEHLENMMRDKMNVRNESISKLIIVENPKGSSKIIILQSWIDELVEFAKKHNLKMHLDASNLWDVSVASNISVKDLAAPFDSITFCLSRLGCPDVGAMLCGSKSFIANARRNYKILGESMRKLGGIAAAGLIGLEHKVPRLIEDHKRALIIAKAINLLNSEIFHVDLETVHTNVVVVTVTIIGSISAETLYKRLRIVNDSNEDDKVIIKSVFNTTKNLLRMDLHCDIDDSMMIAAIRKLRHVMKQLESQAFAQFVCTNCAQNNTIKK